MCGQLIMSGLVPIYKLQSLGLLFVCFFSFLVCLFIYLFIFLLFFFLFIYFLFFVFVFFISFFLFWFFGFFLSINTSLIFYYNS